jgi:hypothetical protein
MERTTIMLPHELKIQALKRANIMGISLGQLIRDSLTRSIDTLQDSTPIDDPLFSDTATYERQTPADLSLNHDNYLYGADK